MPTPPEWFRTYSPDGWKHRATCGHGSMAIDEASGGLWCFFCGEFIPDESILEMGRERKLVERAARPFASVLGVVRGLLSVFRRGVRGV